MCITQFLAVGHIAIQTHLSPNLKSDISLINRFSDVITKVISLTPYLKYPSYPTLVAHFYPYKAKPMATSTILLYRHERHEKGIKFRFK